jgi:hypothetical protein
MLIASSFGIASDKFAAGQAIQAQTSKKEVLVTHLAI